METVRDDLRFAQRTATLLLSAFTIVVALVVGGMLISGWGGGILDNRIEWVYWAGTIIGAAGVATIGAAVLPVHPTERAVRRTNRLIRTGLALFLVAPVICVFAVMTDYWI